MEKEGRKSLPLLGFLKMTEAQQGLEWTGPSTTTTQHTQRALQTQAHAQKSPRTTTAQVGLLLTHAHQKMHCNVEGKLFAAVMERQNTSIILAFKAEFTGTTFNCGAIFSAVAQPVQGKIYKMVEVLMKVAPCDVIIDFQKYTHALKLQCLSKLQ